jgi:hypothetical protein
MFETLKKSYMGAIDKYDFMLFLIGNNCLRDSSKVALVDIRMNTLFHLFLFDKKKDGVLSLERLSTIYL